MAKYATKYTEEMDAIIRDGYERGVYASEIAGKLNKMFGLQLSKSSINGRAARIGVVSKAYTSALTKTELAYVQRNGLKGHRPYMEDHLPDREGVGLGLTCQYIHGDARDRNFCGAEVWEPGRSYCAEHHLLCYRKPDDRERRQHRFAVKTFGRI